MNYFANLTDYDGLMRPIKITLPEGNNILTAYDDATCGGTLLRCSHNPLSITRVGKPGSGVANLVQSFTYEPSYGKLASATDARGAVTNYAYNAATGELTQVLLPADPAGVRPQSDYAYTGFTGTTGSFRLLTAKTDKISAAAGNTVVTAFAYAAANKFVPATTVVDSGGLNLATAFTYDAIGNLTLVNGPRADVTDTTAYVYDAERRQTQVTDALGKLTRNFYDAYGNLTRVASQLGTQWQASCISYTPTFQKASVTGPALVATDSACPAAAAPNSVTTYAYDVQDRLSDVTETLPAAEGGNRLTRTAYTLAGQVATISRAVGTTLAQTYATYAYTPNGSQANVRDAKNQLTTYAGACPGQATIVARSGDGHDRLDRTVYPSKANGTLAAACNLTTYTAGDDCERYTYDANGNLLTRRTRDGQSIAFAFDNLNRLTAKTTPVAADKVAYSYDLLGRRLTASYPAATALVQQSNVTNVYDKAGRLTSTASVNSKLLAFQYDPAGNRTRLTPDHALRAVRGRLYPDGTALFVQYSYDSLNRVSSIKENGTVNLATYSYDDLSRRASVTLGNSNIMSYAYNGDDTLASLTHNLQGAVTTNDVTLGYGYNQVDQINARTYTNNAYVWNGHYNVTRPYAANGLNQYTTSGAKTLTYDARGSLTGDGTWTFAYDVENRLKAAARSGLAGSFLYDPVGRLNQQAVTGTATTTFLYDGDDMLAEYDTANALLRRYVHGPGIDEPLAWYEGTALATKRYFQADHQGSIIAVTDGTTGAPISQFSYGPYGEPNSLTGSPFRYTGQRLVPGVGFYYYKARFYSPYLGRFLQTDPIGTADDMNLYAYVGNDPISSRDPSGLADVNLFPRGDQLKAAGDAFDIPGYFTITGHADGSGIRNRSGANLDGAALATIAQRNGLKVGEPIFLGACNCALGNEPQVLADRTGSAVYAANGFAFFPSTANGTDPTSSAFSVVVNSQRDKSGTPGTFLRFDPGGNGVTASGISSVRVDPQSGKVDVLYGSGNNGSSSSSSKKDSPAGIGSTNSSSSGK